MMKNFVLKLVSTCENEKKREERRKKKVFENVNVSEIEIV